MRRAQIAEEVMTTSRGPVLSAAEARSFAAALMEEVERSRDLPAPIRAALIATASGMVTRSQEAEAAAGETAALMSRMTCSGASDAE